MTEIIKIKVEIKEINNKKIVWKINKTKLVH